MRGRTAQISLTMVALLLGILLVMQLRTQGRIAKSLAAQSATDQSTIISNLYEANVALRGEVRKLSEELEKYDDSIGLSDLAAMERELKNLSVVNGLTGVVGQGVEFTTNADLRPEDLQDLINEMRNAGAEAIGLNGIRVTVRTAVTRESGIVAIDGIPVGPPYKLISIGHPETLERALLRKGGLVTYFQNTYSGATFSVNKQSTLAIPAGTNVTKWVYAVPAKDEQQH